MDSTSPNMEADIKDIQQKNKIVGREKELRLLLLAVKAKKHIILEGAVGTGKTWIAKAIANFVNANFFRVDGSEDVLGHVLVGYFDPPALISKGYIEDAFIYGPLSQAMMEGGCLFLNELNRIPESTQNVLLSALDERVLIIPKLKKIIAKEGFIAISTQNPAAHVGVSALGEALKDRFVWIHVDYQSEPEEIAIVQQNMQNGTPFMNDTAKIAVKITRATREHPDLRRGASIRAAIDLGQLVGAGTVGTVKPVKDLWYETAVMALHSKIEIMDGIDRNARDVIIEIVDKILEDFQ